MYLPLRRGDVTVHDERIVHGSGACVHGCLSGFHVQAILIYRWPASLLTSPMHALKNKTKQNNETADGNASATRTRKTYVVAFRSEVRCSVPKTLSRETVAFAPVC
jgi:hypothetical protein